MFLVSRRAILLGGAASLICFNSAIAMRAPGLSYGCDDQEAGPLEADVYVSTEGDDAWDGSLSRPVRTINRGIQLLSKLPQGSLAIRGGIYREHVQIRGLIAGEGQHYRIHRYGTEKVVISALEPLQGWVETTKVQKSQLGLPPETIFEARVPLEKTSHKNAFGLNLFWRNERIHIAYRGNGNALSHTTRQYKAYKLADCDVNTEGNITEIRSESLRGWQNKADFATRLLVHVFPNVVHVAESFSAHPLSGALKIDAEREKISSNFSGNRAREVGFLLENDPGALIPGSYVVGRDSSDAVTVYFAPGVGQHDLGQMYYAVRSRCVSIIGCRNVTLWGLDMEGASAGRSSRTRGGYCLYVPNGSAGIKVLNCSIGKSAASHEWGVAAYISECQEVEVSACTVRDTYNSFGIHFRNSVEVKASRNLFDRISMSPLRVFGVKNMEFSFSKLINSAFDIHANKFNYYLGCDNILNYGIVSENTGGYATYQSSSRVHFAFCRLDVASQSYDRAIVTQNFSPGSGRGGSDGTGEPLSGSRYYYWNNTLYARPGEALTHKNSLSIGPKGARTKHIVVNNILFGFSAVGGDIIRSHNVYKALNWQQNASHGWRPINDEELALGLRLHRLQRGLDFSSVIENRLKSDFPGFKHWNLDADGLEFDWKANPPVGSSSIAEGYQPWVK